MLFIIDLTPGGLRNRTTKPRSQDQLAAKTVPGAYAEESISLPELPSERPVSIHSAQNIAAKYKLTTIENTRIVTEIFEMTSALEGSAGSGNHHVCKVTLTGPSGPTPAFSVLKPQTWRSTPDKQIEVEMRVGAEECPNWDYVNTCLNAIKLLVTSQDGYLNEAVTTALTQHMGARVIAREAHLPN
jgi:hypothetical protein